MREARSPNQDGFGAPVLMLLLALTELGAGGFGGAEG